MRSSSLNSWGRRSARSVRRLLLGCVTYRATMGIPNGPARRSYRKAAGLPFNGTAQQTMPRRVPIGRRTSPVFFFGEGLGVLAVSRSVRSSQVKLWLTAQGQCSQSGDRFSPIAAIELSGGGGRSVGRSGRSCERLPSGFESIADVVERRRGKRSEISSALAKLVSSITRS
jgi:hypothetical protein